MLLDRPYPLTGRDLRAHDRRERRPVLVDFYADWCGPCKMMAPFVDEIARERQGQVLVAKLDTDRSQTTSMRFNIRSIPTTIVFKAGKEAARQTGAVPKKGLEALLANV
jgi:thioredoxin